MWSNVRYVSTAILLVVTFILIRKLLLCAVGVMFRENQHIKWPER